RKRGDELFAARDPRLDRFVVEHPQATTVPTAKKNLPDIALATQSERTQMRRRTGRYRQGGDESSKNKTHQPSILSTRRRQHSSASRRLTSVQTRHNWMSPRFSATTTASTCERAPS